MEAQQIKVSVGTVGNKRVTVIRKPFDVAWVREQLAMGYCPIIEVVWFKTDLIRTNAVECCQEFHGVRNSDGMLFKFDNCLYTPTILPALPKHPKSEDAPLLYRYMSEGLKIYGNKERTVARAFLNSNGEIKFEDKKEICTEITHAVMNGERVDIAILEDE